jgi:N-formylglutamate deformylase
MVMPSFEIVEPEAGDSPIVVEVPHAGLEIDGESASWIAAPSHCRARDADLYVDELFAESPRHGATLVVARLSRYVVDLNRAEDDYDGTTVLGGPEQNRPRGVIWRLTSDGQRVHHERLTRAEAERRLEQYYRPYHAALTAVLERKRDRFGFAVLLCAHSMPTPRHRPRPDLTPGRMTDLVPGTCGGTSAAPHWIELVDSLSRAQGYQVQHDDPYRGGFSTVHYGRPADHFHAVQLDIARRLYMDETSLTRDPDGFPQVVAFANQLVTRLVEDGTTRVQRPGGVT